MLVKNWDIHYFDEVESTNLIVKERIRTTSSHSLVLEVGVRDHGLGAVNVDFKAGVARQEELGERFASGENGFCNSFCTKRNACGYVAVAKSQTGGKGMRGHKWCSPKGGLYFSLLLDTSLTTEHLHEVPLRIANVVMGALQPLSSKRLTIKPPNDIVISTGFSSYETAQAGEPREFTGRRECDRCSFSGEGTRHISPSSRSFDSLRSSQDDVEGAEDSQLEGLPRFNRSATSASLMADEATDFPTYSLNKSSKINQLEGLPRFNQSAASGHFKVEKLVGISTELYLGKLCVGIGINVFHPEEEINIEGENNPVYLSDFCKCNLTLDFILETVLEALNAKLEI